MAAWFGLSTCSHFVFSPLPPIWVLTDKGRLGALWAHVRFFVCSISATCGVDSAQAVHTGRVYAGLGARWLWVSAPQHVASGPPAKSVPQHGTTHLPLTRPGARARAEQGRVSLHRDGPQGGTSARLGRRALVVCAHVRPGCSCTLSLPPSYPAPRTPGSAELSLLAALRRAAVGGHGPHSVLGAALGGCGLPGVAPQRSPGRKGVLGALCPGANRWPGEVAPVPVLGHVRGGSRLSPARLSTKSPALPGMKVLPELGVREEMTH